MLSNFPNPDPELATSMLANDIKLVFVMRKIIEPQIKEWGRKNGASTFLPS